MRRLPVVAVAMATLGGCAGNEARPVAKIDVNDRREQQARAIGPTSDLMDPMRDPSGPGRIIYEPAPNLSKQRDDSLVTAPFGITAAPDSAGRSPTAPAPARRDSAQRDTARQDTATRDTARRPR